MREDEVLPGSDYWIDQAQHLEQLLLLGQLWLEELKKGLHVLRCSVLYRK